MSEKNESISSSVEFDTTNAKAQISELNRQMRVLESGFRATAAGMDDWSTSATGLESRNSALNKQIDLQKQKVAGLSKVYVEMAADEKASAKVKEEMQIKINKETETLGKLETELRGNQKALSEMDKGADKAGESVEHLGKKSDSTKGHLGGLKSALKGLAATAVGVAAAVGSIAAGLATTIGPASDLAETTSKISIVFGEQAEAVLEFGKSAATSLGMSKNAALSAAGTYGNLFRAMGIGEKTSADLSISLVQLASDLASFNNMDPTEVLDKLRSGLSGETEPLKVFGINLNADLVKAKAMSMGLIEMTVSSEALEKTTRELAWASEDATKAKSKYGENSRQYIQALQKESDLQNKVSELLEGTPEDIDAAAKAQATYALIMEQTSLTQGDFARTADGLANKQRTLGSLFDDIKADIGTGLLPVVLQLATKGGSYLEDFSKIMSDSGGDIVEMADGVGQLVSRIVGDVAKDSPQMLQAGLGILQGIVTAIASNLPTLLPAVISMITSLVNFIVQNLPMIITAALQIIIALANGLSQALPTLIPAIVAIIPQIVTTLLENLPLLILAAVQLILALAQGLIAALPVLIPEIPKIVQAIYDALITSLPLILTGALQMIVTLGNGIIQNLPMIWDAAVQTCQKFVDGINGMMSMIKDIGIEIVRGVWNGMFSMTEWYRSKVLGFFTSIVDSVKKSLGIHSASTVFAGIGENMAAGLGIGFERQFEQIRQSMGGAMGGLAGMASAYPATGSGSGGRTVNTSMGGIHITVNGNTDAARVGRTSEQGVQQALRAVGLA